MRGAWSLWAMDGGLVTLVCKWPGAQDGALCWRTRAGSQRIPG